MTQEMKQEMKQEDLYDEDEEYVEEQRELIVFERVSNQEAVAAPYTAATVLLDARSSSSLNWDEAIASAEQLIEQDVRLVFDFDLGLSKPLAHVGQFQAACFALTHFRETVWQRFKAHTAAAILARSHLNLIDETATEFFTLLASHLPDDCPLLLLFDCHEVKDACHFALFTTQDRYPRFRLALKEVPFATDAITWADAPCRGDYVGRQFVRGEYTPATVGILLPTIDQYEKINRAHLKKTIDILLETKTPFKIIPEEFLTMEWEGLETIVLTHNSPSLPVRRALDGFIAASGKVVDENDSYIL
jgi:hypothetical protein